MGINWDDFKRPENGEYPERWKPENIGDTIKGKITEIRVATMPDGAQYPSLTLDTGTDRRELLASQTMLLRELVSKQPKIGDIIEVKYDELEKISGGRTLKKFKVQVTKGNASNTEII